MPGPIIKDPTPPWLKPQNASVLDPAWKKLIRAIVQADPAQPLRDKLPAGVGGLIPNLNLASMAADPQSQVLALMGPTGTPKAKAARAAAGPKVVGKGKTAAAKAATPSFLAEVKALFPILDKYTKKTTPVSAAVIRKRLEAATNLSDEARTALTTVADSIGDKRVTAQELHTRAVGGTHKADRVLRRVPVIPEGKKQIPGAPVGVSNARQERKIREDYIKGMELGVKGREWYTEAGDGTLFYANDDPARARMFAEDLAVTSATAGVDANTGFGVKGYNQRNAGVPIRAGKFPGEMSKKIGQNKGLGEVSGATGQKRSAFSQNVARGGGFDVIGADPRPVHDIWDGELWQYTNDDGSPTRTGFGPAQHAWMDRQAEKAIATANARGVGGFIDWDVLKSQAAGWTGAQIAAGKVSAEDAARSYADFFDKLVTQGSREVAPGRTTGHMPQLLEPENAPFLQDYHERVTQGTGLYDPEGQRDQIAAGFGGLVGRSFDGPGFFGGKVTPGRQTKVLTGTEDVPGVTGARRLDEGSNLLMRASEATYGVLGGQDAAVFSRVLPSATGAPKTAWDLTLPGGNITPGQLQALYDRFGSRLDNKVIVPIPGGVRLSLDAVPGKMGEDGEPGSKVMDPLLHELVAALGGRGKVRVQSSGALPDGGYMTNDWRVNRVGQGYFPAIERMGTDRFDRLAPPIAQKWREIDQQFARETNGRFTLSPVMDEVKGAIANEGWAGLQRLAKKYGIGVTLLVAGLRAAGEPVPEPDSPQGSAPADTAGVQ